MRGTILKARTTAGDVFWHVPTSGEVVTKAAAAAAEYKLSISRSAAQVYRLAARASREEHGHSFYARRVPDGLAR